MLKNKIIIDIFLIRVLVKGNYMNIGKVLKKLKVNKAFLIRSIIVLLLTGLLFYYFITIENFFNALFLLFMAYYVIKLLIINYCK